MEKMTVGQFKWVKMKLLRKINKNMFWVPKIYVMSHIKFGEFWSSFDKCKNTHKFHLSDLSVKNTPNTLISSHICASLI